jgi:hypothetical protein
MIAIIQAFRSLRRHLTQTEPALMEEKWRQPLFGNELIKADEKVLGFHNRYGFHQWALKGLGGPLMESIAIVEGPLMEPIAKAH